MRWYQLEHSHQVFASESIPVSTLASKIKWVQDQSKASTLEAYSHKEKVEVKAKMIKEEAKKIKE